MEIPETLTRLRDHLASLGDGRDLTSETDRAVWWAKYNEPQTAVSGLVNAPDDLMRAQHQVQDFEAALVSTRAKQAELEQALREVPDRRSIKDGRKRDAEYDRQQHLKMQLELSHAGKLLCAPGEYFIPPAYFERRVAKAKDSRDRAQRALDGYIKQAEALLTSACTP